MKYIFYSLILGLSLLPYCIAASEKPEPTAEQKQQWEENARQYRRMVQAAAGKLGLPDHSSESHAKPTELDKKAKL